MKRKVKRVYRCLTPVEAARVRAARQAIEGEKDELLAKAREYRKLDEAKRPKAKPGDGESESSAPDSSAPGG